LRAGPAEPDLEVPGLRRHKASAAGNELVLFPVVQDHGNVMALSDIIVRPDVESIWKIRARISMAVDLEESPLRPLA